VEVVIIKRGVVARRGVSWRFLEWRNGEDGRIMGKTRMETRHGGGSGGGSCCGTDLANVPTEHYHCNISTFLPSLSLWSRAVHAVCQRVQLGMQHILVHPTCYMLQFVDAKCVYELTFTTRHVEPGD
jgi:hypothetical protein